MVSDSEPEEEDREDVEVSDMLQLRDGRTLRDGV